MVGDTATVETLKKVLALDLSETMTGQDAGVGTFRGLLYQLAEDVWVKEQGFNGKRPFGNSGWQYDVYAAVAEADLCEREWDDFNETWVPVSRQDVDRDLIVPAIRLLMLGKMEQDG